MSAARRMLKPEKIWDAKDARSLPTSILLLMVSYESPKSGQAGLIAVDPLDYSTGLAYDFDKRRRNIFDAWRSRSRVENICAYTAKIRNSCSL